MLHQIWNICLDFDPSNSACHICSYDSYLNSSSNFQTISQIFPPSFCIPKSTDVLNLSLYVNSDKNCSDLNTFCDGTKDFPLDDLFTAFDITMSKTKKFMTSNIIIYVLGEKTHFFYSPSNESDAYYIFRRDYVNISLEPLYCEIENIIGCHKTRDKKAVISIKNDDLFFFI